MPEMKLVIDGLEMARLLRSPAGPVGRHLIERATVVQLAAKRQAPVDSGCLRDSIVKRVESNGVEMAIRLVSDTTPCSPTRTSYSLFVHEGTAPHDITARNGGMLRFQVGGDVIFRRTVHHPGTQPIRFLTDNLHLALL